jgi:hypothetical protein
LRSSSISSLSIKALANCSPSLTSFFLFECTRPQTSLQTIQSSTHALCRRVPATTEEDVQAIDANDASTRCHIRQLGGVKTQNCTQDERQHPEQGAVMRLRCLFTHSKRDNSLSVQGLACSTPNGGLILTGSRLLMMYFHHSLQHLRSPA